VECKDYDYTDPNPFDSQDVLGLYPISHTSELDHYIPEPRLLLETARVSVAEGDLQKAFEAAKEASSWLEQVN